MTRWTYATSIVAGTAYGSVVVVGAAVVGTTLPACGFDDEHAERAISARRSADRTPLGRTIGALCTTFMPSCPGPSADCESKQPEQAINRLSHPEAGAQGYGYGCTGSA